MLLVGNVFKALAKSVLIPLWLTAAASATDVAIHKKMFGSRTLPPDVASRTTLVISNEEMNDIIKIVKSLEESGFLINGVSQTIKSEAKEQKGGFLEIELGTLGVSFLGNLLTGKGTIATSQGRKQLEIVARGAKMYTRCTARADQYF